MQKRNKLIQLRAGKPQASVAEKLGITRQMLGAIEKGSRTPSLGLAFKIADYYGVPVDDLFRETHAAS